MPSAPPFTLPVIFDFADGLSGRPGTPTPPGSIIVQSSGSHLQPANDYTLEQAVDSPIIERGEQATVTMRFPEMSWAVCQSYINAIGRGYIMTDSFGNSIKVLTCTGQRLPFGKGSITIVGEGISFDVPPDEFSCVPSDMGINIMKHPRYFTSLYPNPIIDSPLACVVKQAVIRAVQTYQDSPFFPSAENLAALNGKVHDVIVNAMAKGKFTYTKPNPYYDSTIPATKNPEVGGTAPVNPATTDNNPQFTNESYDPATNTDADNASIGKARAAASEIIQKLWRVEDSPPVACWEITWAIYSFLPQYLSPGGYIEDPIAFGLPDYFYSPTRSIVEPIPRGGRPDYSSSATIFDLMAQLNPQCFSNDGTSTGHTIISWLRKPDVLEYNRTWFKLTMSWIGAAIGVWDSDLNSKNQRPATGQSGPSYGYNLLSTGV